MLEEIKIAIGFLGGGAVGSVITWFASEKRERRQLIREFRRKLGTIRSTFERQPEDHLFELYHNTVPKLQGDVAALKGDLRACRYRKLRSAADAFTGIPRDQIEKPVAGGLATEFETGRQRILKAIDEIERALDTRLT